MKTVFSNDMTIHVWAQQNQEHGRSSHGNLRFINTALYSYSTPIANFIEHKNTRFCLITNRTYSVTTSGKHMPSRSSVNCEVFYVKHIGVTGGQAPHWPMSYDDMPSVHKANIEDLSQRYHDIVDKLSRAKTHAESYARQLRNAKENAKRYIEVFDVNASLEGLFPDVNEDVLQATLKKSREASKAKAEQTKLRNAQMAEQMQNAVNGYIAGESVDLPWDWVYKCSPEQKAKIKVKQIEYWRKGLINRLEVTFNDTTLLRVAGDNIETSRGAEFPVKHGKLAFKVIKKMVEDKQEWHTNGHKLPLGHFQIDTITPEGDVKAGCHYVKYSEIELIAKQLELV